MSNEQERPTPDRHTNEYEVGYRKPPAAFRFKKGVSGNPRGRPPGRRSLETPTDGRSKTPPNNPSAGVSDEELLRMVKDRKLTWQALFDLIDERRAQEAKAKASK